MSSSSSSEIETYEAATGGGGEEVDTVIQTFLSLRLEVVEDEGPDPGVGEPGRSGIDACSTTALAALEERRPDVNLALFGMGGVPALGGDVESLIRGFTLRPALAGGWTAMPRPRPITGWGGKLGPFPPRGCGAGDTEREEGVNGLRVLEEERGRGGLGGGGNDIVLMSISSISLA